MVVRGDSMSSVGYQTGDIIADKAHTERVRRGRRDGPNRDGDHAEMLSPTERGPTSSCEPCSKNPEHCAIVIDEQTEDWEIVGVVVGAMIGPPR